MRSTVRNANISAGKLPARRLGLIVNPIAGMGGAVGLKGTDGVADRARALGAQPLATARAEQTLRALRPFADRLLIVAAPGAMGSDLARRCGFAVETQGIVSTVSCATDTRNSAAAIAASGVDLLLFAGGDGTARDILDGAPAAPVLGIPTGVKMHSGVFANSPTAAGLVTAQVLGDSAGRMRWRQAEVLDLDEEQLRAGHVSARLYGTMCAPVERMAMQACKVRSFAGDDAALDALAARITGSLAPGVLTILGCGTTMQRIKSRLSGTATLLGVDVALNGRLIASDVSEERLLRLIAAAPAQVIVSVTGGQGFVFGRGNQQISPRVLGRVGRDNIMIVTGAGKLVALDPPCLRVDTGDAAVDAMLAGYTRVHTAPGHSMMMRIAA